MTLIIDQKTYTINGSAKYLINKADFSFASDSIEFNELYFQHDFNEQSIAFYRNNASFVLCFPNKQVIYAVVDCLGLEALYYTVKNEKIYISTNYMELFKCCDGLNKSLNENYIGILLTGVTDNLRNPYPTETIFKHISQISYGSYLKIDSLSVKEIRYWGGYELNTKSCGIRDVCFDQYRQDINEILINDFFANTPKGNIAALLSGGIDSTCIVGFLKDLFQLQQIHTISLIYPEDMNADEYSTIENTVRRFGLKNHHYIDSTGYMSIEYSKINHCSYIVDYDWFYDQYYNIANLVKECCCSSLFDGLGGDELFGISYSKSFFSVNFPDYLSKDFLFDSGLYKQIMHKEREREQSVTEFDRIDYKRLCIILKNIEPRYIQYRKDVYCNNVFNWKYPYLNPKLIDYILLNQCTESRQEGYKYIMKLLFSKYISNRQYFFRTGGDYSLPILNGLEKNIDFIFDLLSNGYLLRKGIVSKKKLYKNLKLMKTDFNLWYKLSNYFSGVDLFWNYITFEMWYHKALL